MVRGAELKKPLMAGGLRKWEFPRETCQVCGLEATIVYDIGGVTQRFCMPHFQAFKKETKCSPRSSAS